MKMFPENCGKIDPDVYDTYKPTNRHLVTVV